MRVVVVSGFFNPLHCGHLDMIEGAAKLGDRLIVVVNNDRQQLMKKGKIILPEGDRMRLVKALRVVDEVVLAVDEDSSVRQTLREIAGKHEVVFANGGDRQSESDIAESEVCRELGIRTVFGVGGDNKYDSSSRINAAMVE